jgi:hypothetical protein
MTRMIGPAFWTILLLALATASAPASAAACTVVPMEIVVTTSHETVRDDNISLAELDRMSQEPSHRHAELDRQFKELGYYRGGAQGLTKFSLSGKGHVELGGQREGDRVCISISRIIVELEATSTIRVAKEYSPGSCEHEVTLEHERRHAELNAHFVANLADPYQLELRRALQTSSASGPARASRRLQMKLSRAAAKTIDRTLHRMTDDLLRQQEAIDTAAEYISLTRACRNW